MKVYLFPGQGSQHIGMGEELFAMFPEYAARADQVLGYSITQACLADPQQRLGRTEYTQPALFTVNALAFLRKVRQYAMPADYFAGHSLGEYNALFAAGAFDFEIGLQIVKKRGELMGRASGGGMAAILGCSAGRIVELVETHRLSTIDVANFNAPMQTVLSGPLDDLEAARPLFEAAGASYFPLPVSAPFHSRYMRDMSEEFADFLSQFRFNPLRAPVLSNVTAQPYQQGQIVSLLTQQLYSAVRWTDSIAYLMDMGADDFEELGPGSVLTKLVRQIGAARPAAAAAA